VLDKLDGRCLDSPGPQSPYPDEFQAGDSDVNGDAEDDENSRVLPTDPDDVVLLNPETNKFHVYFKI